MSLSESFCLEPSDFDAPWPSNIQYEQWRAERSAEVLQACTGRVHPAGALTLEEVWLILETWDRIVWPENSEPGEGAWETYLSLSEKGLLDCTRWDQATVLLLVDERVNHAIAEFEQGYQKMAPPYDDKGQIVNWVQANLECRPHGELLEVLAYAQETCKDRELPRIHHARALLFRRAKPERARREFARAFQLEEDAGYLCHDVGRYMEWCIEDGLADEALALFERSVTNIKRSFQPRRGVTYYRDAYECAIDGLIDLVKRIATSRPPEALLPLKKAIVELRAELESRYPVPIPDGS